jgi:hypothetical protein
MLQHLTLSCVVQLTDGSGAAAMVGKRLQFDAETWQATDAAMSHKPGPLQRQRVKL